MWLNLKHCVPVETRCRARSGNRVARGVGAGRYGPPAPQPSRVCRAPSPPCYAWAAVSVAGWAPRAWSLAHTSASRHLMNTKREALINPLCPAHTDKIFCCKEFQEKVGVKVWFLIKVSQRTWTDLLTRTKHQTYLMIFYECHLAHTAQFFILVIVLWQWQSSDCLWACNYLWEAPVWPNLAVVVSHCQRSPLSAGRWHGYAPPLSVGPVPAAPLSLHSWLSQTQHSHVVLPEVCLRDKKKLNPKINLIRFKTRLKWYFLPSFRLATTITAHSWTFAGVCGRSGKISWSGFTQDIKMGSCVF